MNFIDLFAGAGGLSEGFIKAGYTPIAHIEMNKHAVMTLETRAIYHYLRKSNKLEYYYEYQKTYNLTDKEREVARKKLLDYVPKEKLELIINNEISEKTIHNMFKQIDKEMNLKDHNTVDVIVGGPPCQAYSLLGRARDKNSMKNDDRNYLYKLYVRFLKHYQPKAFVFENVQGILTAQNGTIYKNLNRYLKRVGYSLQSFTLNAKDFGVPQNRKRVILIGFRKDIITPESFFYHSEYNFSIDELFKDLPNIQAGEKYKKYNYACKPTKAQTSIDVRNNSDILTHHHARTQNARDLKIYEKAIKKWNEESLRLKYTDLEEELMTHNNRKSFLDRFKVVAGNLNHSHTVVAHLSKDGHHFIHPDIIQTRSITVREAARLQTFPDNYYFEGPRTANFVQIGNAVPPLMAKKIAFSLLNNL
ncbi:DNA cytosine methyltransferase [Fusibacter ferrireducens]|uniref:Cytosine-specific methyltransferase n=1 Tax=Fusibacter ferrireducens TaxID=2785058 RepID=A0ABS0A035_9FIRM|nr:DNA cytosine methyltransferase [Fusibacter ferrireducens]MBF4695991.1 DNA cytosine methyltransferase [Fusibacter ferrireducens]